jgi:hypothetical protein
MCEQEKIKDGYIDTGPGKLSPELRGNYSVVSLICARNILLNVRFKR